MLRITQGISKENLIQGFYFKDEAWCFECHFMPSECYLLSFSGYLLAKVIVLVELYLD